MILWVSYGILENPTIKVILWEYYGNIKVLDIMVILYEFPQKKDRFWP